MRVLFLFSDYVLHNGVVEDYRRARPDDELAVVKIPLVLEGKGRRETAERILPQLSRRFVTGKLVEFGALLAIAVVPKLLARGAVFRRLRRVASVHRLPFHRTTNVMSDETLDFGRAFAPDVVVSLCHQILKEPLISLPRLGIVNVHPGVLPDFRGIQPYFWQLAKGAERAGATLHLVEDEGIDTGGVLARATFRPPPACSVQLAYFLTGRAASHVLPDTLAALERGELEPRPQSADEGAYWRWPDSDAFDALRARGHALVSFRQLLGILTGRHDDFRPDEVQLERRADRQGERALG